MTSGGRLSSVLPIYWLELAIRPASNIHGDVDGATEADRCSESTPTIRSGAVPNQFPVAARDVGWLLQSIRFDARCHCGDTRALLAGDCTQGSRMGPVSMQVMDRRYQVFISSTFTDLIDERREVMQALLEMDCLPAGMELFPAGDTDQWTLIKGVIEQSDYYLVVLGGRYGSATEEGVSYTEKEYDYAVELGIPVMGFVPAEPDEIPISKTDRSDAAAKKLAEFREKVQSKMTKDWKNAEDLGSKVTRGLIHLIKNNPRPGWVRGDHAMTPETRAEIAELNAKIAQFEKKEVEGSASISAQMDVSFAHGQEQVELSLRHKGSAGYARQEEVGDLTYTWDEIVEVLGPTMIDEAPEPALRETFNKHMLSDIQSDTEEGWTAGWGQESAEISDRSWGAIIVQLRALRLITTGTKKRTVSDKAVYWKLTAAGDEYLVSLRAVLSAARSATLPVVRGAGTVHHERPTRTGQASASACGPISRP